MFVVISYLQMQLSIFPQDFPRQEFRFFILFQLRICSKVAKKAATIQKYVFQTFIDTFAARKIKGL